MAIIIVEVQFRERSKQMLTRWEILAMALLLLFSLLAWVDIMDTARDFGTATWKIIRDLQPSH